MERQEELAVVPLVPVDATPSTDTMLRMVLNHEALLVHHVLNDSLSGRPGQVAQATGAFAKAISQVTGEFNRSFWPFAVWCGCVCQVVTVLRSSLPQVR